MTTDAQHAAPELHVPVHPVRLVTASSLFDGHDASINIMRRILQSQGAEVIHLGHNRSVQEVVDAAIEEDVQGVAVSSYQGGHVEYFEYLVELLREAGAGHVHVVGGGGGVIVADEIERLRASGVTIFCPEDGQRLGLPGMVNQVIEACDTDLYAAQPVDVRALLAGDRTAVARAITGAEAGALGDDVLGEVRRGGAARGMPRSSASPAPVARASPRSPTSSSAGCGVDQQDKLRIAVRRRSTRPGAAAAGPCSATGSG